MTSGDLVVFNGTVMRGQPAHANLSEATFVREVWTSPRYRLYSIDDLYPAMVRDDHLGQSIHAELFAVPARVWAAILEREPPGLYRGPVELLRGEWVEGMLGSAEVIERQREITRFGGWREYLLSR